VAHPSSRQSTAAEGRLADSASSVKLGKHSSSSSSSSTLAQSSACHAAQVQHALRAVGALLVACRTAALYKAWRQLGFQQVLRRPATVEGLLYPNSVRMTLWMLLGCLPWLLLRWLRLLAGRLGISRARA
jgi:hypothetical protein